MIFYRGGRLKKNEPDIVNLGNIRVKCCHRFIMGLDMKYKVCANHCGVVEVIQ